MSEKDIAEKLAEFNKEVAADEVPTLEVEEETPAEEETETEETTPETEETPAEETEEVAEPTPEELAIIQAGEETEETETEGEEVEEEAGEVPTLPEAYHRAAVHQGWKPEDVDEFFKENPSQALKTLANIYQSTNKLSERFAKLGAPKLEKPAAETKVPAKDLREANKAIEALEKEFGEDDPMIAELKRANDRAAAAEDRLDAMDKKISETATAGQTKADATDAKVLEEFFVADTLKPYTDFYGDKEDWDKLSPGQQANRWAVVNMADQILAGAETLGEELSITKALEMAHLNVSDTVREKVIRAGIQKQVVKRSKGVSLPASSGKSKTAGKDQRTLEEKTAARMKKALG